MSGKSMVVEIAYRHENAPKVKSLVEEFERAGKFKPELWSKSFLTYEVIGTVSGANPVTETDVRQLRSLGAKVDLGRG